MPRKRSGRKPDATGRSKGDGQFVRIPYPMAHSAAFRSLSGNALKVWVELRSRFNGYNNGRLSLSYQQAADLLHISKSSVARAFRELTAKGFVRKRKDGKWYGRLAAEWTVTDEKFNGCPATRDWQNWRPPVSVKKQKTVLTRSHEPSTVPGEYRQANFVDRTGTRQPHLTVIDGAA